MNKNPRMAVQLTSVKGKELLPTDTRYREKIARITLDSMVQFVGLLDAQGNVLEINQFALDVAGIKLADVEGKPFWMTFWWQVSKEINQILRESIQRASQGEFVRWETTIFNRAGGEETIFIDVSLMPVKDEHGNILFICVESRDITEKKAYEREIARQRETHPNGNAWGQRILLADDNSASHEHLRAVVDTTPACIKIVAADGTLLDMSAAGLTMVGADSAQQVIGGSVYNLIADEYRDQFKAFNERICQGAKGSLEFEIVGLNGTRLRMETYAAPLHAPDGSLCQLAITYDVTQRKRDEEAIGTQNERLALLWEAAGVLLSTDEPDTMLQTLFAKISESLGLDVYFNFMVAESEDHLRLVSCAGVSKEIAQSISRLEFGQAICGNVALQRKPLVKTRIHESSEPMVQLVKGFGIRAYACNPLIAGGRLLGTLSFASRKREQFEHEEIEFLETISQYVTAAYERLGLIEQLRYQDQRKDEFLATLAHELRNPLAPIRNAVQILHTHGPAVPKLQWARDVIDRQIDQMARLVDDLLDVSRITRGNIELRKQAIELHSAVNEAVEVCRPLIEQWGHTLSVELPEERILLEADPTRLAQILFNLLNNAAKYTEPGGKIRLTAERQNEIVEVRVKDTGVGIPPDMLVRVFELFRQVDTSIERSQGGLGIGLTLVQRLVSMHGGEVEAHSEGEGKGSEFVVRLPVSRASETGPVESLPMAEKAGANHRRILVVDDNHDSADSMAMFLELMGHEVRTANDGLAAIHEATVFAPQVILLDIGLPKLNGYEVARKLREQYGEIIVLIALTGWGQDEDKRRSHDAGFDAHLVKPVDFESFKKLLHDLTNR